MVLRNLDFAEILPCGPDANVKYMDELLQVAQKEGYQVSCVNHS